MARLPAPRVYLSINPRAIAFIQGHIPSVDSHTRACLFQSSYWRDLYHMQTFALRV